ncbi:endonuclease Q family protein [bacterium]|nr:endonuclease Q family protein [bacterium]
MFIHADLHVHIGKSSSGRAVKITAAHDLTFENIALECADRKGIGLVGVVDCASPPVIADIDALVDSGEMVPLPGGGLRYRDQVTVILGAEFETHEPQGGMSHHVSYFPDLACLKDFSETIGHYVTNRELSSQACGLPARILYRLCADCGGTFVPAHCFTPHKSVYGSASRRAAELFGDAWDKISAIELGLSADSDLADHITELSDRTFLTNSDAHSLPRIGREYNLLEVEAGTFDELLRALRREGGRRVLANFGLDPRLGKYHRTFCEDCQWIARGAPPAMQCEQCGSRHVTKGVLDRILEIADTPEPQRPEHRPHYQYQVPLQFVPGVGSVTYNRLINRFGSEMAVLHDAEEREIGETVGSRVAALIVQARQGTLPLQAGGGGRYGKAVPNEKGSIRLPGL